MLNQYEDNVNCINMDRVVNRYYYNISCMLNQYEDNIM